MGNERWTDGQTTWPALYAFTSCTSYKERMKTCRFATVEKHIVLCVPQALIQTFQSYWPNRRCGKNKTRSLLSVIITLNISVIMKVLFLYVIGKTMPTLFLVSSCVA
jgi:hypothetical protein